MVPYLSGIETNMNDLVVGACLLFSGVVALVTFDNHSSCFYKNQEDVDGASIESEIPVMRVDNDRY